MCIVDDFKDTSRLEGGMFGVYEAGEIGEVSDG